jgi:hypothetical protein
MTTEKTMGEKQLLVDLEANASDAEPYTFLGLAGPLKWLLLSVAVALLLISIQK